MPRRCTKSFLYYGNSFNILICCIARRRVLDVPQPMHTLYQYWCHPVGQQVVVTIGCTYVSRLLRSLTGESCGANGRFTVNCSRPMWSLSRHAALLDLTLVLQTFFLKLGGCSHCNGEAH